MSRNAGYPNTRMNEGAHMAWLGLAFAPRGKRHFLSKYVAETPVQGGLYPRGLLPNTVLDPLVPAHSGEGAQAGKSSTEQEHVPLLSPTPGPFPEAPYYPANTSPSATPLAGSLQTHSAHAPALPWACHPAASGGCREDTRLCRTGAPSPFPVSLHLTHLLPFLHGALLTLLLPAGRCAPPPRALCFSTLMAPKPEAAGRFIKHRCLGPTPERLIDTLPR